MITTVAQTVDYEMANDADPKTKTVTLRVHSDIVSMITLIEAMYSDLGEKFSRVAFADSLIRPGTKALHKKALEYFKKKKTDPA